MATGTAGRASPRAWARASRLSNPVRRAASSRLTGERFGGRSCPRRRPCSTGGRSAGAARRPLLGRGCGAGSAARDETSAARWSRSAGSTVQESPEPASSPPAVTRTTRSPAVARRSARASPRAMPAPSTTQVSPVGAGRGRGREREPLPARGVEPVGGRRGGRRRGPAPAPGARRLDPVAAPLEGVAGQPYRRTAGAAVDGRPVDGTRRRSTGRPGCASRYAESSVRSPGCRSDPTTVRPSAPRPVGADEAGEGLAGADLQQHQRRVGAAASSSASREPHRPAQVVAPVLGAGRLLVGDPGAGDVGQEGEGRGVQGDRAHLLGRRGRRRRPCRASGRRARCAAGGSRRLRPSAAASRAATASALPETTLQRGGVDRGDSCRPSPSRAAVSSSGRKTLSMAPSRHLLDEPAARGHQAHGVLQGEHPGQAGGDVLADAVSGHGLRPHAPGLPQPGEGVLHGEQHRLGDPGAAQHLRGVLAAASACVGVVGAQDEGAQVLPEVRGERLRAPVELGGEDRLARRTGRGPCRGTERPARGRGTRPARSGAARPLPAASPASRRSAATACLGAAADDGAAVLEVPSAAGQGVGDVVEVGAGVAFEVVREALRGGGERRRGPGGQRQQPDRAAARGRARGRPRWRAPLRGRRARWCRRCRRS